MVEMVRKICEGEGFGQRLAEGSYRLAEGVGHPELSMTVKKQEMSGGDPRAVQGMGVSCATSNRGGCPGGGYALTGEVLGDEGVLDPHSTEGKAAAAIESQDLIAALDSSGACLFCTFGIGVDELAEMLTALTGVPYSAEEFLKAGERIWNNERMWNLDNGYTSADDTLPPRLCQRADSDRPVQGRDQPARDHAARVLRAARLG